MDNPVIMIVRYIVNNNPPLIWIPKILEAFVYQIVSRSTNLILSKKLFNGKQLFLFPRCNVSSLFIYSEIPDKKEINILRKIADEDTVFLDIGANVGSYCIMMADKVNKVYAFEPYPISCQRAKMNFLLNGMDEKRVINNALSNKNSKVYFSDLKDNLTENRIVSTKSNSIRVNAIKLDGWIKINKFKGDDEYLVKIDVEGHEKEVLRGGKHFFTEYNVRGVIFEYFGDKKLLKMFDDFGYNVKKVDGNNYWAEKKN